MDESSRIALLARVLAADAADRGVDVGIGDDAAVLDATVPGSRLVWTIDEQAEDVHFVRGLLPWRDVGWRSYMAAASDLAAMGAVPWCALCAMVLPPDVDDIAFQEIALGQAAAAAATGAPVVGGNLSRGRALSLATTLLGRCDRAVLRGGAAPGDGLYVAGRLGLAAAGLRALRRGMDASGAVRDAIEAWRRPRALVAEGRAMGAVAHAAIDVSDGLARDAGHLAAESEVCVVLDESAIESDGALLEAAAVLGESARELVLSGGEDYALLAASPVAIPGFRRIGEIRRGAGLLVRGPAGEAPIEPKGYDHFG